MADEAEDGLHLAYEAREQNELLFYEADARRRAALQQLKALTPMDRIDLRSVAELAPILTRMHEQLHKETAVALRFGERVHEMHGLVERWRRHRRARASSGSGA